jgi:membrane protein CcdC involved in cytochrome C biogenesis
MLLKYDIIQLMITPIISSLYFLETVIVDFEDRASKHYLKTEKYFVEIKSLIILTNLKKFIEYSVRESNRAGGFIPGEEEALVKEIVTTVEAVQREEMWELW